MDNHVFAVIGYFRRTYTMLFYARTYILFYIISMYCFATIFERELTTLQYYVSRGNFRYLHKTEVTLKKKV